MSFCGLIKGISPKICILCVRVKVSTERVTITAYRARQARLELDFGEALSNGGNGEPPQEKRINGRTDSDNLYKGLSRMSDRKRCHYVELILLTICG